MEAMTTVWKFHGGIHLPDNKALSTRTAIRRAALPRRLILPLQQHIGEMAKPLVRVGERVLKGQMIASPQGLVSAPVHAPTSGLITAIQPSPVPHPSALSAPCLHIEPDGLDEWGPLPPPLTDYARHSPEEVRERIRLSGIVGLGGAAFPTSVKLNPGPNRPIHTLILNGAECEPFITCDDMLMRERAERVIAGAGILQYLLGAGKCLIGIEDNKPEAIAAMQQAVAVSGMSGTRVVVIPTLYPSGGEKQLIRLLTGQEVPSGGIPAEIGLLCQNVATAAAVAEAVLLGRPLISRLFTLTGAGIAAPQNLEVLIGTPLSDLVAQCGGYTDQVSRLILGGPMMGFALADDEVPVTKASNCLLAASASEAPAPGPATACIRCGECAKVCPVLLLPQQMYWHAKAKDLDKVQDQHLFDCIECGCCAYVCPAHIPLVQYFRYAKAESWAKEREQRQADQARFRHEAKVARLQRQEEERKSKLRKRKEDLESGPAAGTASADEAKKAAIEAAIQRAAAKKAALGAGAQTPDQPAPAQARSPEGASDRVGGESGA